MKHSEMYIKRVLYTEHFIEENNWYFSVYSYEWTCCDNHNKDYLHVNEFGNDLP